MIPERLLPNIPIKCAFRTLGMTQKDTGVTESTLKTDIIGLDEARREIHLTNKKQNNRKKIGVTKIPIANPVLSVFYKTCCCSSY